MTQSAVTILGKRIKELRVAKACTQAALAEMLGCESMTVSRYERGEYAPSIEVLEQIALALNITMDRFFVTQENVAPTTANLRHELCDIAYQADETSLKEIVSEANRILKKANKK
jgi:transcriptional regulator with XRE-family HTH domain